MDNDPRYLPIESILPNPMPACSKHEARRAYQKLIDHFGGIVGGHQTDRACWRWGVRRCWIALKPTTGHHKGWGRLIHDMSHTVFSARHPNFRTHDGGHAQLEAEMATYAVEKGWLTGGLRAPVAAKPTAGDKLAALEAAEKRWTTKLRRATTALKRVKRRRAAILRRTQLLAA